MLGAGWRVILSESSASAAAASKWPVARLLCFLRYLLEDDPGLSGLPVTSRTTRSVVRRT